MKYFILQNVYLGEGQTRSIYVSFMKETFNNNETNNNQMVREPKISASKIQKTSHWIRK